MDKIFTERNSYTKPVSVAMVGIWDCPNPRCPQSYPQMSYWDVTDNIHGARPLAPCAGPGRSLPLTAR